MKKKVVAGNVTLEEGAPKICVPLTGRDALGLADDLEKLDGVPWDMVEWRADYYEGLDEPGSLEQALQMIRQKIGGRPLLFTYRTAEEGGKGLDDWEHYRACNERAAGTGLADLIDLEMNRGEERVRSLAACLHDKNTAVLLSFHNFHKTPSREEMVERMRKMQEMGGDVVKLAVMPETGEDVLRLMAASLDMRERYADRPFVTMSMGPMGAVTRISGGLTGSAITFGTAGEASAPGQLPARKLALCLQILSECDE